MTDAQVAIWIVSDPRPEHVRVISWLNDSAPADFFLVKIEGIRIGDSIPAPLLTLIVNPSEEQRKAGEVKKEIAEGAGIRRLFWSQLLERTKGRIALHSGVTPGDRGWIAASAGKSGLAFSYYATRHTANVELYIDRGQGFDAENLARFESFLSHKDEIEHAFGGELDWQRLEGRRGFRIRTYPTPGGYSDEEQWPEIQEALIDAMTRVESAFRPHIEQLSA